MSVSPMSALDGVPRTVETIAGHVAGLLVLGPEVQRLALVCPLLASVFAGDDSPVAGGNGTAGGHQRRPIACARAVAGALTAGVLVERVQRHAGTVYHRATHHLGRRLRECAAAYENARHKYYVVDKLHCLISPSVCQMKRCRYREQVAARFIPAKSGPGSDAKHIIYGSSADGIRAMMIGILRASPVDPGLRS